MTYKILLHRIWSVFLCLPEKSSLISIEQEVRGGVEEGSDVIILYG